MSIFQTLSIGTVLGKVWPFVVAIFFFGLLIFFHELGHFIFARLFRVKVNEFAMGMGPAIFKFKKKDTQYSLRLLPIGGYCAMEGEDSESEDDGAFCNKKPWQRFIIVAAGGVVNIIMGVIIVMIMLATSKDLIGTPFIHSFTEDAVSSSYGLEVGDELYKINGRRIFSDYDVSYFMSTDDDGVFDFTIKRNGKKIDINDVKFKTEMAEYDGEERLTIIYDFIIVGVEPSVKTVIPAAFRTSVSYARLVYISLFDLITGKYHVSDLSGPIGTVNYIADAASESVKQTDFTFLFVLMALIAINIGLFNLLPLPALDGGRLLFILVEMITRKPVPKKFEGWVHAVGMVLLLALMAFVSFSDIWKLIKG